MKELNDLLATLGGLLSAISGYPLWLKGVIVVVAILAVLFVINMMGGGEGGD